MRIIKLLIDRNIQNLAVRAVSATQAYTVQWGELSIITDVYGYGEKALPKGSWKRKQIEALPTIARLAREGKLVFCTSSELDFESFHASRGWQGTNGDMFHDIKYEHVPAAIERSFFSQTLDFSMYISGEAQVSWYKDFLLRVDEKTFLEKILQYKKLPDFDRRNFANLVRFRELCRYLNTDDHIRDAFHLWTAETNGLDYLLTADKKFINKMTNSTPLDLPTPPINPTNLVELFGISELDPLPLSNRKFNYLYENEN